MKKHLTIAALVCAFTATSSMAAVTLTLSGNPNNGPQFVVGSGTTTPVLDGSLVRIGTFDTVPDANGTFESFASSFREFGRTTIGHTTAAAPVNLGRMNRANIPGIEGGTSPDGDGSFVDKTIYIWVYNSATADPSVAQGIFSTSFNTFKDQATALSIGVNTFITPFGQHSPLRPQENATSVDKNANNQATFFHLSSPVPEPTSTVIFGLLAGLGIMRRRR